MPKIFISYRRKDSLLHAGRIFDQLALRFDPKDIFMDFAIPTGGDFPQILQDAVTSCDVCLVIIGNDWENIIYQRTQENADDWVRFEVKTVLERQTKKQCVVMPILVGGATMPDIKRLPEDIHKLNDLNALSVRDFQRDFHNDIAQLVADIQAVVGKSAPIAPKPVSTPSPKIDVNATFLLFEEARNDPNKRDEARQLLAQLRAVDNLPITIASTLDDDEKELWDAINRETFQKKRDEEYQFLRHRAKGDKKRFRASFEVFSRAYPNFDPDPLGHFASRAYDLLPQPFEWVHIPAGKVTLITEDGGRDNYIPKGEGKVFNIPAFSIAKYPVTNAQYEVFVNHPDGYQNPKWWEYSPEAKEWRANNPEMNPSHFDGDDCPRETVSWYDSVAFCRWLSAMTGDKITLPTEQQWQRAAVGDTKNIYPWGNDIDKSYANYNKNMGRTTPVTQYIKGSSPYGVMDMTGNVWEWCLTGYETGMTDLNGTDMRVLRGGSWNNIRTSNLRALTRDRNIHYLKGNLVGFRCSCL